MEVDGLWWSDEGGKHICRRRSSSSTRTALEAIQKRLASRNSHTHYPPRARWQHHIYTCRMSLKSTGLLTSHNSVSVYKFWTESNFSKNCPKFQILTINNIASWWVLSISYESCACAVCKVYYLDSCWDFHCVSNSYVRQFAENCSFVRNIEPEQSQVVF